MIMMMTDPDRVALSAFLPAFLFRFIHPFMPTSTPTFHRNVPPAICHTSYYPVRSSSSLSHRSKFVCFLPTSQHFGMHARPSITSHAFSLFFAQHLSRSSSISISFATKQPTTTQKNLQSKSHPALLPSFFASQARVHAPTFDYLCIYYPWRYLSRTKKKDLLGK